MRKDTTCEPSSRTHFLKGVDIFRENKKFDFPIHIVSIFSKKSTIYGYIRLKNTSNLLKY